MSYDRCTIGEVIDSDVIDVAGFLRSLRPTSILCSPWQLRGGGGVFFFIGLTVHITYFHLYYIVLMAQENKRELLLCLGCFACKTAFFSRDFAS